MGQLQFRSDDTIAWEEGFGNGSDGALTISSDTTESPIDSVCTGTAGAYSLSATNASFAIGQIILIHKSRGTTTTAAGTWELNKITAYTAGTITLKYPLQNAYQDSGSDQSQVRVMKQYSSVTIDSTKTYSSKVWDQSLGAIIGWFCNGATTITGTLNASGLAYTGGQVTISGQLPWCGEGTEAASFQNGGGSHQSNGNGGGSGGPGGGGSGSAGGGGNAAAGGAGTSGEGGDAVGNAGITVAIFGGGGGGGNNNGGTSGAGGRGAGFILIVSDTLTITGSVTSGGAAGANSSGNAGSSGGGAGGPILYKTRVATLGTALTTAVGGAGGTGTNTGGTGSVGRIHLDYKTSVSGTTSPALDSRQDASLESKNTSSFLAFM